MIEYSIKQRNTCQKGERIATATPEFVQVWDSDGRPLNEIVTLSYNTQGLVTLATTSLSRVKIKSSIDGLRMASSRWQWNLTHFPSKSRGFHCLRYQTYHQVLERVGLQPTRSRTPIYRNRWCGPKNLHQTIIPHLGESIVFR